MFYKDSVLQVRPRRYLVPAVLTVLLASAVAACSSPAPRSPAPPAPVAGDATARVLSVARRQVGVPYRYGGRSPRTGFDCSGLVYYSHAQAGLRVPRTTRALFRQSRPVSRARLRPGDLVFFRVETPRVGHVGIYLGQGRFVHAPSSGKRVAIERMDNPYWKPRFLRGGRIP